MVERHRHFDRLLKACEALDPIVTAVAAPEDKVSLQGALLAARYGIIRPILVGSATAEHEGEAGRLRRVAQALERVLSDQDLVRQSVVAIIRDFIDHERKHMKMEEGIFFPAALIALRPKDWADTALKLADRRDPLYEPGLEQKFNMLRRKILEIEAETDAERVG